jgi:thiol-disulfide isomerase/thioredoxin
MKTQTNAAKRVLALLLAAFLVLPVFQAAQVNAAAGSGASTTSHYNYFNDVYEHLDDENHVLQTATYEDIINLFESEGTYVVLFGGAWSDRTQANIGFINQVAKQYGVKTIYNFDTRLDGKDFEIAQTQTKEITKQISGKTTYFDFGEAYVELVKRYFSNLDEVLPTADTVTYAKKDTTGTVVAQGSAKRIEAPFLFVYNKKQGEEKGKIISSLESPNVWNDYLTAGTLDAAKVDAYKAEVGNVFKGIEKFDTINSSEAIKAAFNKNAAGKTILDEADGELVFERVTYHELTKILETEGNYTILFGGSWCPNTRAAIKFINQYAKKYNIDKVYFWDTKLDAGISAKDTKLDPHNGTFLQVRDTNHPYANLYVDLVNKYLTNISTQYAKASNNVKYTNENGVEVIASKAQVPFLFQYNKDNKDAAGNNAPILGHIELMYSWDSIQPGYKDTNGIVTKFHETYTTALDKLFTRVEATPTGLLGASPTSSSNDDGQIIGTKNKALEYKLVGSDAAYIPVTGEAITNLVPGTYSVRYAAKSGYQGPVSPVKDGVYPVTAVPYLAGQAVEIIVPTFIQEQAAPTGLKGVAPTTADNNDGQITGTTTALEYKHADALDYIAATEPSVTNLVYGTYDVRYAAKDGYRPSPKVEVVIPAFGEQVQDAPVGLAGVAPTTAANDNGQITGTTTALEYRLSGAKEYTPATDLAVTGLAAGTYNVRFAAKAGFSASPAIDVVVPAFDPGPEPSPSPNPGSNPNPSGPVTTTPPAGTDNDGTAPTTTVAATTDAATGATVAKATASAVTSLVEQAKKAEAAGKTSVLEFKVEPSAQTKSVELSIPRNAFNEVASSTKAGIKVNYGIGTVSFDAQAVSSISKTAETGDISIIISKVELTEEGKQALGDRPVYDFSVFAGTTPVSTFGGSALQVSVPYALKDGEDQNAIIVYYVTDSGELDTIRGKYNAATGSVDFVTTHFSQYIIGYNKVSFADVPAAAWYKDAVGFLAARSITTGTDENHYSPNATVTRGQFVVLLLKAYGITPNETEADNFADAGNTYYTKYLAAAKRLGITTGIDGNTFEPDSKITRQDLFTLLYRSLEVLGELPKAQTNATLSSFSDAGQIASYANDAFKALVEGGIITGSNAKLSPKDVSTRAQVAQVLYNLLSK